MDEENEILVGRLEEKDDEIAYLVAALKSALKGMEEMIYYLDDDYVRYSMAVRDGQACIDNVRYALIPYQGAK